MWRRRTRQSFVCMDSKSGRSDAKSCKAHKPLPISARRGQAESAVRWGGKRSESSAAHVPSAETAVDARQKRKRSASDSDAPSGEVDRTGRVLLRRRAVDGTASASRKGERTSRNQSLQNREAKEANIVSNTGVLDADDKTEIENIDGEAKQLLENVRTNNQKPVPLTVERLPKDATRLHRLVEQLQKVLEKKKGNEEEHTIAAQMKQLTTKMKKESTYAIRWRNKTRKATKKDMALLERCRARMVTIIYAHENADKARRGTQQKNKSSATTGVRKVIGTECDSVVVGTRSRAECLDGTQMKLLISPFAVHNFGSK